MTSLCRWTAGAVLLAIFSISPRAFSDNLLTNQESTVSEKRSRTINFYGGRKYEAATPLFRLAYALNPDPPLLYNLGIAHRQLSRTIEALNYFHYFLRAAIDVTPMLRDRTEALVRELKRTPASPNSKAVSHAVKEIDRGALFNQLYREGVDLYQNGKYEACIEKFQTAFSINPDSLLAYNLGQAHRKLRQEREALNNYQFYLRTASSITLEMRSKIEGYIQDLRQTINDKEQRSLRPRVLIRETAHQPRPLWRLIVGPVLMVSGTVTLGFGAWGLSINGTCVDIPSSPELHCNKAFDTSQIGTGLVGAGSVLLLGGVLLAALPGSQIKVEHLAESQPASADMAQIASRVSPTVLVQGTVPPDLETVFVK